MGTQKPVLILSAGREQWSGNAHGSVSNGAALDRKCNWLTLGCSDAADYKTDLRAFSFGSPGQLRSWLNTPPSGTRFQHIGFSRFSLRSPRQCHYPVTIAVAPETEFNDSVNVTLPGLTRGVDSTPSSFPPQRRCQSIGYVLGVDVCRYEHVCRLPCPHTSVHSSARNTPNRRCSALATLRYDAPATRVAQLRNSRSTVTGGHNAGLRRRN